MKVYVAITSSKTVVGAGQSPEHALKDAISETFHSQHTFYKGKSSLEIHEIKKVKFKDAEISPLNFMGDIDEYLDNSSRHEIKNGILVLK